ncbi:MAG: hypothetical protein PUD65_06120 [Spirochaetales bacterium]|nr:hypothetical protein [Spirochaetales bacterium]
MKKIISIAVIFALVAASAFAGISGNANIKLGYDFTSGAYGFKNGDSVSVDVKLASETAEALGEGDVFAGVKASLSLLLANKDVDDDPKIWTDGAKLALGAFFSIDEAYVSGQDWKVAITGTQSAPDFAKSAIDTVEADVYNVFGNVVDTKYVAKSYKVSVNKAPGVTASYKDWKVAAGFNGGKADASTGAPDFFNYHVSAFTPSLTVAEGLTVKAAAVASGIKNATKKVTSGIVYDETKNYDAFGASAQVAYAADAFSASVAADFGMKKTVGTDSFKADFDIAGKVAFAPITADVYFSRVSEKNWLSAKVSGSYEGISGNIYAQDILGDDVKIGAKAEYTADAVTVGGGAWFKTTSKAMEVSANVKYAAEKFTAKAGAAYGMDLDTENKAYVYATASVESDAIINGATLSLAYGKDSASNNMNFLSDNASRPQNFGAVTAKCTITF